MSLEKTFEKTLVSLHHYENLSANLEKENRQLH